MLWPQQTCRPYSMPDTPQITLHTVFPPEVDRSSLRLTTNVVWPAEESSTANTIAAALVTERSPIPKPKGVVGRIKEGGYSLIKVLGWDQKQYREVQVGRLPSWVRQILIWFTVICSTASSYTLRHQVRLSVAKSRCYIASLPCCTST
jgi:hypothetical protein